LTRNNISRVIVVRENKPIGIITTRDMMPIGNNYGVLNNRPKEYKNRLSSFKRRIPFTAEDIMTSNPLLLIDQEESITDAAKLMIGNQISGIPVVNKLQDLVGIITKTDIIKAIVDLGKNKDQ
jgi:CBS domain-containing protein